MLEMKIKARLKSIREGLGLRYAGFCRRFPRAAKFKFIDSMKREGVRVEFVMDLSGDANRFQSNFRNHRKVVVVGDPPERMPWPNNPSGSGWE